VPPCPPPAEPDDDGLDGEPHPSDARRHVRQRALHARHRPSASRPACQAGPPYDRGLRSAEPVRDGPSLRWSNRERTHSICRIRSASSPGPPASMRLPVCRYRSGGRAHHLRVARPYHTIHSDNRSPCHSGDPPASPSAACPASPSWRAEAPCAAGPKCPAVPPPDEPDPCGLSPAIPAGGLPCGHPADVPAPTQSASLTVLTIVKPFAGTDRWPGRATDRARLFGHSLPDLDIAVTQ